MSKASIIDKEDDRSIDIIILIEITLPERNPTINCYYKKIWPYGLQLFRRLERTSVKLKKNEADLKFLKTCKSYEIIPKFLYFKLYRRNLLNSKLY